MDRFEDFQRRSDALCSTTSPIFAQSNRGTLEGIGTGLFFTHRERLFVVSAAHVLRRMRNEHLLIGEDHLAPLNGRFFATPNDDVDLGFVPLDPAQSDAMGDVRFLSERDVDMSDHPERTPGGYRFYVLGYRADMNAPDGVPASVDAAPAGYLAHAAPEATYGALRLSADSHLVLTFDRRVLFANATECEPDAAPEGMSGSGVWQFSRSPESDRLVAILIEHSERQRAIIATRIRPLIDALTLYVEGGIG